MNIPCPACHRLLRVPDDSVGRKCRCPSCREKFIIADPNASAIQTVAGIVVEAPEPVSHAAAKT